MHEFLVSAVAFIVLLGIMVLVHEFGHFITAKLCGVRVEAFSLGFGPKLVGFTRGETEYKICALPLGGFVKMTGEAPEQNLEAGADAPAQPLADDPGAFTNHPRWQRMLIGFAGPFANFVLAFVAMFVYFAFINEVPAVEIKQTAIEWIVPGSAADQAGLKPGDVITHFENADRPGWEKVMERAVLNTKQSVPVTVDRNGQSVNLTLRLPAELDPEQIDFAGMLPQFLPTPIRVQQVMPGTPAEKAGLRAGDQIELVDGNAFHTVPTLLAYMQAGQGKELALTVLRDGQELHLTAHPAKLDTGYKLGFATVPTPYRPAPLGMARAVSKSTEFCVNSSSLIFEVIKRLFTRQVAVSQLAGPVGIARMAGDAAETRGWMPKFSLATQISLNLGILNLMPFPILDGGMILILLIESFLRRDISINVKERIYQVAFFILIAFFAFVIVNDIAKLPIFSHLKP